jgi:hypothetical protein
VTRVATLFALLLCSACSRPLLVDDASPTAATVEFQNLSTGTLQQFYFKDPVTCDGASSIDYFLDPGQTKTHKLPTDRLATIWTSGFNLPAKPGYVAWCRPTAFTARLEPGKRYRVTFVADSEKDFCGTLLTTAAGEEVARVKRTISGPEVGGGGVMAGPMSCSSTDDLRSLAGP